MECTNNAICWQGRTCLVQVVGKLGGTSAKRIKLLNGQWINRDIVGARNILLRALVDQPHCFSVAVAKCA